MTKEIGPSAEIPHLIDRALRDGPFTMRQLADDAGISYDSLYSWAKARRVPRPDNLEQLAFAFEQRARAILQLADELRQAAGAHG